DRHRAVDRAHPVELVVLLVHLPCELGEPFQRGERWSVKGDHGVGSGAGGGHDALTQGMVVGMVSRSRRWNPARSQRWRYSSTMVDQISPAPSMPLSMCLRPPPISTAIGSSTPGSLSAVRMICSPRSAKRCM